MCSYAIYYTACVCAGSPAAAHGELERRDGEREKDWRTQRCVARQEGGGETVCSTWEPGTWDSRAYV